MRPRITFIGGGSYLWMPKLLNDCFLTPELYGYEIVLYDITPVRFPDIKRLEEAVIKEFGVDFTLTTSTNLKKSLEGADFVVISISTGGLSAMKHDLEIPWKYGVHHTVGDTVGPGGISRALRNIPVFQYLGNEIQRICPKALVMNITNPMTTLTRALWKANNLKTVGLCHGVGEGIHYVQEVLDLPSKDGIDIDFNGVNHFSFITDVKVHGQDGWPLIKKALAKKGGGTAKLDTLSPGMMSYRLAADLLNKYGVLPGNADRHTAEFMEDVITPGSGYGKKYGLHFTTVKDRISRVKEHQRDVRAISRDYFRSEKLGGEELSYIMAAMLSGKPHQAVINYPNLGQFPEAPKDAVVETWGMVDNLGIRPIVAPKLPPYIRELCLKHIICQELTVDAAIQGDWDMALEAFAIDPVAQKVGKLKEMVGKLMQANKQYLPQFFGKSAKNRF